MSEIASLLQRAARYLDSARLLLEEGDNESSVSRTYYAMFFAAQAVLLTRGLSFSSHKGVIAAFGQYFVKEGPFSREMGRELNRAFEKRQLGDYEHTFVISREEAGEMLVQGKAFVEEVGRYLKTSGRIEGYISKCRALSSLG